MQSLVTSKPLWLSRYNAWPVQPGCRADYSGLCFSWCHGGSGILCGADQQSEEQAKETETTSETTAAYATGSSTKDAFCVKALACQRWPPFTGCFPGRWIAPSEGAMNATLIVLVIHTWHHLIVFGFLERKKKKRTSVDRLYIKLQL